MFDWNKYETHFYNEPNDILIRENLWVNDIVRSLNLSQKKCLDFGCGTGFWLKEFVKEKAIVTGIDISPEAIESCTKNYPDAEFHLYDGTKLPFRNNTFEIVFAAWVFQEMQEQDLFYSATNEVFRVLCPSGKFVFISNVYPSDRKLIDQTDCGDIFENNSGHPPSLRFFKNNTSAKVFEPLGFSLFNSSSMGWSYCEIFNKDFET